MFTKSSLLLFALASLIPATAAAQTVQRVGWSDSRTPIRQLPYTINEPGSYYLTGNLESSGLGIRVLTGDVTIDLGGFTISGPSNEICISITDASNVRVQNGTIRDFSSAVAASPIFSTGGHVVEDVAALDSQLTGILLNKDSRVESCIVDGGDRGIVLYEGGLVSGSTVSNCTDGIILQDGGGLVADCVVRASVQDGIVAKDGSLVRDCLVLGSGRDGIVGGAGTLIDACVVRNSGASGARTSSGAINGSVASASGAAGLKGQDGSRISDSHAVDNAGSGLETSGFSLMVGSSAFGNAFGMLSGSNQAGQIMDCFGRGNSTDYAGGLSYGPELLYNQSYYLQEILNFVIGQNNDLLAGQGNVQTSLGTNFNLMNTVSQTLDGVSADVLEVDQQAEDLWNYFQSGWRWYKTSSVNGYDEFKEAWNEEAPSH